MSSDENTYESMGATSRLAHVVTEPVETRTDGRPTSEKSRTSTTSRMLASALTLAEEGLRVMPLKDQSKKPRLLAWQKKATTDPKTILRWFKRYTGSNLGICTGGGIIVLDVDPKNGGANSLDKLVEEHGPLPPTAEVLTGSGGSHYFFRVEPGVMIGNRGHFLPGLDIRGEGGQVVAPPSIHPETGREYQFLHHPSEGIASVPSWLLALLTAKLKAPGVKEARRTSGRPPSGLRKGDAQQMLEEMRSKFPIPGPGHRHGLMTRVVGSLVGRGYTDDLIVEVAMVWWKLHYADGRTSTRESVMLAELYDCLESTRVNKSFIASMSGIDHRMLCRAIKLNGEQETWLEARVVADDRGEKILQLGPRRGQEEHSSTCKRGTQISQMKDRLCFGADERSFVIALIVHAMHKRLNTREAILKMTHAQFREIIQDRHTRGQEWRGDNKQIGRLKKRFIAQPGRPAENYELLRETRKGKPGIPSEYEPTGIEFFLAVAVEPAASVNLAA